MATRRIVPRNDDEGSIGKPTKQWGDVQTKKINGRTPAEFIASETPREHSLDTHTAVTLAELNAVISDADLGPAYTLPVASAETLGGVKVADPLTVIEGVLGVSTATTSAAGLVELATEAEVQTGTDTTRVVTPAALKAYTEWRPSGFKNLLINGNASRLINQRGIQNGDVFTPGGWRYTFDQWKMACNCASVEFIKEPDAAGLRILDATGGTAFHPFRAIIEMDEDLGGRTFTLTMDFLSNIDSPSAGEVGYLVFHNEANGAGPNVGNSPAITFNSPGTRKKTSVTATAPFGARSVSIYSSVPLADGNYVKYYNIQLEEGSVATPFEQRPIGLEMSLCRRYFQFRSTGDVNALDLSPQMRATPTITGSASPFSYSAEI